MISVEIEINWFSQICLVLEAKCGDSSPYLSIMHSVIPYLSIMHIGVLSLFMSMFPFYTLWKHQEY